MGETHSTTTIFEGATDAVLVRERDCGERRLRFSSCFRQRRDQGLVRRELGVVRRGRFNVDEDGFGAEQDGHRGFIEQRETLGIEDDSGSHDFRKTERFAKV